MNSRKAWVGLAAIVLIATSALAQESRGRVQGMVSDPSGGVVQGAKVMLKNDNTGVQVSRTTNTDGRYLFDYVDPGYYTLTVEQTGFKGKVQKNILVQQRGDVTVDMALEVGELTEVITVSESPVAVQFTTASRDLTIEQQMVRELPMITRNPFGLAALDPSVTNRGSAVETQPYHHRTANEQDLGGGTKYRNDILLDGTPLTAGNKLGYSPPMDSVTEYTVQQNSVDAEFGHNSGGVAVLTMKSGTNEVHGSAYFFGRDPSLNAMTDRASRKHSENPYWNVGGTVGFPIMKNKLFMFAVFEKIENTEAIPRSYTLPTELERQGDFSQSYNADGTLRVIYDPSTNPRVAFPGNRIPANKWDAVGSKIMSNLWKPNCSPQAVTVGGKQFTQCGDDLTGLNNFKYINENKFHYINFSTRLDWQIKDNWKAYARVSRMKTDQDSPDFTNGGDPLKLRNASGTKRNGWNIAADTVYMINASTSFNVRGSYYQAEDKRDFPEMDIQDYSSLWPGQNAWWQPYMLGRPLVYFPGITGTFGDNGTGGQNQLGVSNFWYQQPAGYSFHARFNKYYTKHSVKVGTEVRLKRGSAARFRFMTSAVRFNETANTFQSPNAKTGHMWASMLLGTMNAGSTIAQYSPLQIANTEMYAGYIQDDFKVTKNLTLNLGLRYEWEGGYWDPENRLQQRLDLTDPIPGMQNALGATIASTVDPKTGNVAGALMAQSKGQKTPIFNGAFYFTEDGNKRNTSAPRNSFMPRIGLAWRLDEQTAVRAGWGRFVTPTSLIVADRDALGEVPMGPFSPQTNALPDQSGVPQMRLANPFPQGLTPAYGKTRGRNTLLGDNIIIDQYEQKPPVSDRISMSLQRELPGRIIVDATFLVNFLSQDQWPQQLNIVDPRLFYQYGAALGNQVTNPFRNYGTTDTFPGPLRGRSTVAMWELLKPYPQYGAIVQTASNLRKSRYQTFQIRLQRPFSKGVSVMLTYGYNTSRSQSYYDIQDEYDGLLTWMDGAWSQSGGTPGIGNDGLNNYPNTNTGMGYGIDPKHAVRAAFTAQLPFGRGRAFGRNMSSVLDAVIGGWSLSGMYSYNSGSGLIFGTVKAPESVEKIGKTGSAATDFWFDTTGFASQPANTRRSNPWFYDGLTGPSFTNLDLGLSKVFAVTQKAKLTLRLEAYNALNSMNWANPNLNVTNSNFGKTNSQAAGYVGRQLQYSVRVQF